MFVCIGFRKVNFIEHKAGGHATSGHNSSFGRVGVNMLSGKVLRKYHVQVNTQACSWEWESHGKRTMGWDRHKLLWDGNGTDECVPWTTLGLSMGMPFPWESHWKHLMGWDRHKLL